MVMIEKNLGSTHIEIMFSFYTEIGGSKIFLIDFAPMTPYIKNRTILQ